MKILRKLKEEKGSITMTVVAAMLFITSAILIAYFSLSNQSNDQSKKTRQIADSYKVTNSDLVQKYKDVQDSLNDITTMSTTETKALENYMFAKETNTVVTDELGNNFVVPAGFKVTDDSDNVTEGIVIQDKDENEFVWIPVGEVKYIENGTSKTKTITLGRYYFDLKNGNISLTLMDGSERTPSGYKAIYTEDEETSVYENAIAKNINQFKTKTIEAKGFYIGRYEARVEDYEGNVSSSNANNKKSWTGYNGGKLVEKPDAHIFNYITQNKASELSINMYQENNNFQSDLVNSYAWDTAALFLQEFDNRSDAVKQNTRYKSKYSIQNSLFQADYYSQGTNSLGATDADKIDKICNVYDMADNYFEYTTETCHDSSTPCVSRSGIFNNGYTTFVTTTDLTSCGNSYTFRPILYIK